MKCSNTWLKGFMKREGFSLRRVTTRGAAPRMLKNVEDALTDYFLTTRAIQVFGPRLSIDPILTFKTGWFSRCCDFNHDQVPMCLCPSMINGKSVVLPPSEKSKHERRYGC